MARKRKKLYRLIGIGKYSRKSYPIFEDDDTSREENCIRSLKNEYSTIIRMSVNYELLEVIETDLDHEDIIAQVESMEKHKF